MEALSGWYRVLRGTLDARLPDLTTRQLALLLHLGLVPGPHRVRGLAEVLGFSKPAVTRALDRLSALGWVARVREPQDRRSVLVTLTEGGHAVLRDLERLAAQ